MEFAQLDCRQYYNTFIVGIGIEIVPIPTVFPTTFCCIEWWIHRIETSKNFIIIAYKSYRQENEPVTEFATHRLRAVRGYVGNYFTNMRFGVNAVVLKSNENISAIMTRVRPNATWEWLTKDISSDAIL